MAHLGIYWHLKLDAGGSMVCIAGMFIMTHPLAKDVFSRRCSLNYGSIYFNFLI